MLRIHGDPSMDLNSYKNDFIVFIGFQASKKMKILSRGKLAQGPGYPLLRGILPS